MVRDVLELWCVIIHVLDIYRDGQEYFFLFVAVS